jgi:outer membrane protein assembly factor BamE (lipoprotein component of BamABCDE complex)
VISRASTLIMSLGVTVALSACASTPELEAGRYDPANGRLAQVHAGLTQDEVRSLVGRPVNVTGASRDGETEWIYDFNDTWGYPSEFDVTFDAGGKVESTYAERIR